MAREAAIEPKVAMIRGSDGITLRYRLDRAPAAGKPSRLEIYATNGHRLYSAALEAASGEIRLSKETAAGIGAGKLLFRLVP